MVPFTAIDEAQKLEDFPIFDDASSSQTFKDAGSAVGATDELLGFFRCKALDLAKLVTQKQLLAGFRKYVYFKNVFLVGGN